MTPDDLRVAAAMPGKEEGMYKGRILALSHLQNFPQALAEARNYVTEWPKSAQAFAILAAMQATNGNRAEALAAAGGALAIDPESDDAKAVRSYYEWFDGLLDPVLGMDYYTAAMLSMAQHCRSKSTHHCALKAINSAIAHTPRQSALYVERANIYRGMKQPEEAAKQGDLMIAVAPRSADMLAVAGVVYCSTGQCAKGLKAFADSIAIQPSVSAYLNRIRYLPASDQVGRRRDIDAALKLDPTHSDALTALAEWQHDNGDVAGESATLEKIKGDDSGQIDPNARLRVAQAYVRAGQADKARTVYSELRGFAAGRGDGSTYNEVCYSAAQMNFDLDMALADCRRAVALRPGSGAIMDSLAFVELRLGRYDEAIVDYDKALYLMPGHAPMLFGRGIAKLRKQDKEGGKADVAAAVKRQADIAEVFRKMGVVP